MGVYLTATKTGGLNYGVSVLVTASGLAGSRAQDREKQDTAAVYNLPATTHKLIISEFLKRFTIFVDLGWRDPFGTKFCEIVRRSDTIQNLEKGPNKQVGSIKIIRGLYKSEIGIGYFWVSSIHTKRFILAATAHGHITGVLGGISGIFGPPRTWLEESNTSSEKER